jgi:16S rRNA (adenine1518-N6/adenine1519-N6)-dimethyltransferase
LINVSDLSHLPPLREVIEAHDLRAKKSLGQNFLCDLNLTQKIARQAGNLENCHVIEIGPGPGGLTRALLQTQATKVLAVEFDPRAVAALAELEKASSGRLQIIQADALETDITKLCDVPRAIVANLPYNIATPLLIGWLRQLYDNPQCFQSMTLMFQKEVAQRITAKPGEKSYGRLAILSQWLTQANIQMDIPPSAFTPPPKVTSSVVHFIPKQDLPLKPSFENLEKVTAAAFGQRRKMIRSSLKSYMSAIEEIGINPELRAENLSIEEYLRLAASI